MENQSKTIVFVLGMYRSGTSCVSRVLNLMGAWFPSDMKMPDEYNVRGYWQSKTVSKVNEQIFRRLGKGWRYYGDLAEVLSQESLVSECIKYVNVFIDSIPESENLVVLKEQGFCRLFPIWKQAVAEKGWKVKVVLPYRHPLEVAYSLNSMEPIDIPGGLLIWLSYILDSEKHSREEERLFLPFPEFLNDEPLTICEKIVDGLNLDLKIEKGNLLLIEKIREYLSIYMIKQKVENYDSSELVVHPYFDQTFKHISTIKDDKEEVLKEIDKIRQSYFVSCDLFLPLIERLHTIIRNIRKN